MTKKSNLFKATFEQALIYADGPQVVLLSSVADTKVIGVAIKSWDQYEYPFFAAQVSSDQFHEYLREKFDLRFLLLRPDKRKNFVFDLNSMKDNIVSLEKITVDPENYDQFLPDPGLFARDHTEELNLPKRKEQSKHTFFVDGSWEMNEFSHFYKHVKDIYALCSNVDSFLDKGSTEEDRRFIQEAFSNPFIGGGSYLSLYGSLGVTVPSDNKLHMSGITYNSPGYIKLSGAKKSFSDIKALLANVDDNFTILKKNYNDLRNTLRNNKLLTLPAEKFNDQTDVAVLIQSQSKDLAETLNIVEYNQLLEMSQGNGLIAAKALLSIYRKLCSLQEYFLEGRVSFDNAES